MNDARNINGQVPSISELQKEIRSLKRTLSLAEINLTRARTIAASQDRVETIWNNIVKRESQFFQLVLENMTNILLLLDFDGRFAYASNIFMLKAGILNFGLINGRHYNDVLKPLVSPETLESFSAAINHASFQKSTVSLEQQIDFSSMGIPRIYSILITPMIDDDGKSTGTMALFNDITDIKNALDEAKNASNAKSAFLAKMSHEIRTDRKSVV
jgi:transcriptional regulator with PAS, ATPase and Fis domain